jgi:hypothetical protein
MYMALPKSTAHHGLVAAIVHEEVSSDPSTEKVAYAVSKVLTWKAWRVKAMSLLIPETDAEDID